VSAPIPTGKNELSNLPEPSRAGSFPLSPAPADEVFAFTIVKSKTPLLFKAGSF